LKNSVGIQFHQIIFEYTSLGPDLKTPVRLTGAISMNPAVYNEEVAPRGLVLYNEFTCTKHGERTSQNELDDISFYANRHQNLIAVAADLYGWTLTEDKPQAYCCPEITAVETVDAWDAAMQILKDEGYAIHGLPAFNVGYSSGGFSAIAVQRYTDEHRPDLEWTLTSAGAAPFNIDSVYRRCVASDTSGYPCSFALIVVSYKETYGLDLEYSDVFVKTLCDNVQKWILSKDYNTWEINMLIADSEELAKDCPTNRIFTPAGLDPTSTVGKKLSKMLVEKSLCGPGQTWQPSVKTQYYIMHSEGDKYMDWHVGQEMADYLTARGCSVITDFRDYGNHVEYGMFAFTGNVILLMERYMPDSDDVVTGLCEEVVATVNEHLKSKVDLPVEAIKSRLTQ